VGSLQHPDVVVGAVQNFFDRCIGEYGLKGAEIGNRQGIDEIGLPGGGDLKQADLLLIMVKAVRLQISRDALLFLQLAGQNGELFRCFNENRRCRQGLSPQNPCGGGNVPSAGVQKIAHSLPEPQTSCRFGKRSAERVSSGFSETHVRT
jgi:hypothetical protein